MEVSLWNSYKTFIAVWKFYANFMSDKGNRNEPTGACRLIWTESEQKFCSDSLFRFCSDSIWTESEQIYLNRIESEQKPISVQILFICSDSLNCSDSLFRFCSDSQMIQSDPKSAFCQFFRIFYHFGRFFVIFYVFAHFWRIVNYSKTIIKSKW